MTFQLKTKSALSYFGSDSEVAPQLAAMLDHCSHVTIPFCGGMSILPHLKARAIVANDLNSLAINFYKVASDVRHGAIGLKFRCDHTLSHPDEIEEATELIRKSASEYVSDADLAWAYWATCWIGRKGKGGTANPAKMPSIRRTASGGTNASRIRAASDDIAAWAIHFERCEWESVCFRELLPKVADNVSCGIYVDAPWIGAGDSYLHPFAEQDHRDLFTLLDRFTSTTVVVRYGDDPIIRELYKDWTIIDAASRTQANKDCKEIWITRNTR
jgi:site-specific DNA-adenine methylase